MNGRVTKTEDLPGHGGHELGEEQVGERPVHQGDVQGLRLQGQAGSHLRLRERHLNRETIGASGFVSGWKIHSTSSTLMNSIKINQSVTVINTLRSCLRLFELL